jgi:acyl-coenzyme A synthetase/AMP-(fatty) acid ligase
MDFVSELPRSATGKLIKRVLIDRYAKASSERNTHV